MVKKSIKTFKDLIIYQNLYKAMLVVLKEIILKLPKDEKYDLVDQMRRACKAPCALLAEGFAKRYMKKLWKKYLDDCIGECNEMIHHLSVCMDVYSKYVEIDNCRKLIDIYDISCKQLTKLSQAWKNYHEEK